MRIINVRFNSLLMLFCCLAMLFVVNTTASAQEDHLVFEPPRATANGKHIVLVSGDEEYRSEESCPMLGKILSQLHGFRCTVLFSIDRESGCINPNDKTNIPNLQSLADADLMIIGTRLRVLPDEQLQHFLDFLNAGKPVIGFRTATHAFANDNRFGEFDWQNFGLSVIGDNWVSHHGDHKTQGGRAMIVAPNSDHPLLNSVTDIFTTSDIYEIANLDPAATILLRGAVTETLDPASQIIEDPKNDPMMPLAWLKTYTAPSGASGQCLGTTAGASVDFRSEDLRRLIVNGCYFLTDQDVPESADVTFVDSFNPSFYSFTPKDYFLNRNLRVSDFQLGSSANTLPVPGGTVEK